MGRDPAGRAFLLLALVWTGTMAISIAVAEAALWLAGIVWCANWLRSELNRQGTVPEPQKGPAGDIFALVGTPLMAFWGVSVISALASRAPVESMWELRDVFLFVAPPVAYAAYQHPRMRELSIRVFGAGILVAILLGLGGTLMAMQRGEMPGVYRPDGTLGHYMTYAGALMLAVPVLLTVRSGKAWLWHRIVAVGAVVLLGLTMTRSGWIGCAVGVAVWIGSRFVTGHAARDDAPRRNMAAYATVLFIVVIIGAVVLLSLAGPDALFARGASIFSLDNPTNVDRLAMAATGLRIIQAHPWLGIGPGLMERVYPAWRVERAVQEHNPHLHNDVLQIAAERGLPALAMWIWLMAAMFIGAWRVLRYAGPFGEGGPEARAALAALCAFLTMGLFEYNFGDSEVLMILLYVVTLPFAASSGIAAAQSGAEEAPV